MSALRYEPSTGHFFWRERRGAVARGAMAGSDDGKGYVLIRIDRKTYKAHRLAWLYVYGELPRGSLDHINRQRSDNSIANLREASAAQNNCNRAAVAFKLSSYRCPRRAYAAFCEAASLRFGPEAVRFLTGMYT